MNQRVYAERTLSRAEIQRRYRAEKAARAAKAAERRSYHRHGITPPERLDWLREDVDRAERNAIEHPDDPARSAALKSRLAELNDFLALYPELA